MQAFPFNPHLKLGTNPLIENHPNSIRLTFPESCPLFPGASRRFCPASTPFRFPGFPYFRRASVRTKTAGYTGVPPPPASVTPGRHVFSPFFVSLRGVRLLRGFRRAERRSIRRSRTEKERKLRHWESRVGLRATGWRRGGGERGVAERGATEVFQAIPRGEESREAWIRADMAPEYEREKMMRRRVTPGFHPPFLPLSPLPSPRDPVDSDSGGRGRTIPAEPKRFQGRIHLPVSTSLYPHPPTSQLSSEFKLAWKSVLSFCCATLSSRLPFYLRPIHSPRVSTRFFPGNLRLRALCLNFCIYIQWKTRSEGAYLSGGCSTNLFVFGERTVRVDQARSSSAGTGTLIMHEFAREFMQEDFLVCNYVVLNTCLLSIGT